MGKRRHHHPRTAAWTSPARAGLRRLGGFGAVLALAFQLVLPFLAMPQAASTQAAAVLAQAAAVWGGGVLCAPEAAREHDGKQSPLAGHQCPVCWAIQQTASLLPPNALPEPALLAITRVRAPVAAAGAARPLILSPAQPRGPPFV
jgi:hypothetical protein